jgi:hypothetical protein
VSVVANLEECSVVVKQMGDNPSVLEGGLLLAKGETRTLKHGDTIEFLEGMFKHRVCFEPPPKREAPGSPAEAPKPKIAKIFQTNGKATGSWEVIDDGKMLVYTPNDITHSDKVKKNYFHIHIIIILYYLLLFL